MMMTYRFHEAEYGMMMSIGDDDVNCWVVHIGVSHGFT